MAAVRPLSILRLIAIASKASGATFGSATEAFSGPESVGCIRVTPLHEPRRRLSLHTLMLQQVHPDRRKAPVVLLPDPSQ